MTKKLIALAVIAWIGLVSLQTAYTVEALPSSPAAGTYALSFKTGQYERTALVHLPAEYGGTSHPSLPLVIALHGAGGNGAHVLEADHWAEHSDKDHFIVVAPDGLPMRPWLAANMLTNPAIWNSGQLKPGSPRREIDDVAYLKELLDQLKSRGVAYDAGRVYIVGHSNGGGMAYRAVNEASDRFAALATMGSLMAIDDPHPKHPRPTLAMYGTKDPILPVEGGESHLPWGSRTTPPVAERLALWAKGMGCSETPKTLASELRDVKKVEYRSLSDGGPTLKVLYLEGHGHHWPGAKNSLPPAMMGPNTSKLDATETIWEFLKDKRL